MQVLALQAQAQQLRTENSRWMRQYARAVARLTTVDGSLKKLTAKLEQKIKHATSNQDAVAAMQTQAASMKQVWLYFVLSQWGAMGLHWIGLD